MAHDKKKPFSLIKMAPVFALGAFALGATPAAACPASGTTYEPTIKTLMSLTQAFQTQMAINSIWDRLAFLYALSPQVLSGFSSGEAPVGVSLWANPYYSHVRDSNIDTGYDGDTFGAFLGGDYAFNKHWTVGLMLGVDTTDIKSHVNKGGSDTTGFTVSPYMRYAFNDTYSADATVGFTTSNSENDRLASGTRITGSSDTNRVFWAVGTNASFWQNRWNYLVRVGTSMSRDHRDSFTESDGSYIAGAKSFFGQGQVGVTASYYFKKIRPWVSATYAYDYARKLPTVAAGQVVPSDDRDQLELGLGATLFGYGDISGDVSVKQTVFRENYTNTTVGLTVSRTF